LFNLLQKIMPRLSHAGYRFTKSVILLIESRASIVFLPEFFRRPAAGLRRKPQNEILNTVCERIKNSFAPYRKKDCEIFHELGCLNIAYHFY
jgi:hypothetical protein